MDVVNTPEIDTDEIKNADNFVEAYESFTRVINRLQNKYLDLKEQSDRQSHLLSEANTSLQRLTVRNRTITEFLNSILSSVPSAIVAVDREGKLTHVNQRAQELFGASARLTLGSQYLEAVTPDKDSADMPNALSVLGGEFAAQSSSDQQTGIGVERRIRCADGHSKMFFTCASPLTDSSGNIYGAVEILQDVSELRRLEGEMSRLEALAAVGEMAASVAHQVRNPLVAVKGFASLIEREAAPRSSSYQHANNILKGVDNLERVIDALLRFSRKETLTTKPTNLKRYLRKVVRQFNERSALSDSAIPKIVFEGADQRVDGLLDHLMFREVVNNLLTNSLESTNSPVQATVRLFVSPEDREKVIIEVADDGPGMSPEIAAQIFKPFFTTKAKGSGLGLALVKKMVVAHDGEISLQTKVGVGTTFRITLPRTVSSDIQERD